MSSPAQTLSRKEKVIVRLVTLGMRNKEIADIVGTTENVVKNYLRAIYDKTGVWTRLELALWQMEHRVGVGEDIAVESLCKHRHAERHQV